MARDSATSATNATTMRDVDGARLRGIPSKPAPWVGAIPGPARRNIVSALQLPMSVRYMGGRCNRYQQPMVQGLGNKERNVLPADVWITGNRYNTTALYRPPIAVANPTWRISNVTAKDIKSIKALQERKRQDQRRVR